MININKKSKLNFHWKVNPYDFSKEKISLLKNKISKKYNISKDNIKIIPDFILIDKNGKNISFTNDVILNIQNPEFQVSLFKEYLTSFNIKNYDFNLIEKIDNEVNSHIDYSLFDNNKRFKINWIKWDNFLSYGENNFFDFSTLKGLVLLNGEPANQSGKTTFAIDLIHFLLFGNTDKSATQDKIFNKHIPEATKVIVEGSLTIDGEEYVIKRELTRASLSRRTSKSKTNQKVYYYRVIKDDLEELAEYVDNQQEENSIKTNKVIKDAIGNEDDFDMIICATNSNLDELIEKKESDRGKLLSRWIGLLPIEKKDIIARDIFNNTIKPHLISNHYSTSDLEELINDNDKIITQLSKEIDNLEHELVDLTNIIKEYEDKRAILLKAKNSIDENILKIDITTLNTKIQNITQTGNALKDEISIKKKKIEELGDVNFSLNEYEKLNNEKLALTLKIKEIINEGNSNKQLIKNLTEGEYCPTCKRKLDNVDNSVQINELKERNIQLGNEYKENQSILSNIEEKLEKLKEQQVLYNEKSKETIKLSALELRLSNLRNEFIECNSLKKEYEKNKEIINKNNELDIEIRNIEVLLRGKINNKELNIKLIEQKKNERQNLEKSNLEFNLKIKQIKEEQILIYNWRIYLDMIGRNGIKKIVLRKTLPIINAQISHLLSDICDFGVEIEINEKNDVNFYLIKDNVKSDLTSGSGFEKTAAALAIRAVLGNISALPRLNCIVLDEILGRVAKENYENMKHLYEKILVNFDYIIQISHLDEVKDWHNTIITVTKKDNISHLITTKK